MDFILNLDFHRDLIVSTSFLVFISQLCLVLADRCIRTSFPVASFSTSWTHLTKSDFLPSAISRGTWRAIRDHVQRSYLIVREAEPDQLCVPAPRWNCWPSNPVESLFLVSHNVIDAENLNPSIDNWTDRADFRDTYFWAASISPFTWLILLQCISCFFEFFRSCNFAHLPIFHAVFIVHSYDAESTLTSIQDDWHQILTTDVNYLAPFFSHLSFCFAWTKSCRSRCSF